MKISKVNKLRFGSPFSGVGLLKKERVTITLTPGSYADGTDISRYVDVPGAVAYVSDAQYSVTGSQTELARPWTWAPRKFYLYNEAYLPTPRFYLYKTNEGNRVRINCLLYNCTPITGTYNIHIDVYVFVSHFL